MVDSIQQDGHGGSVDLHIRNRIAVVTLHRGQNLFNLELAEAFHEVLDKVESDPEVAVLITTSEGKFFSNGLDVKYMVAAKKIDPPLIGTTFPLALHGLFTRILTFPMPTIAAINGHAFAGGALLALAHDHMVMQSGRGWWCLSEIFINFPFTPFLLALIKSKLTPAQIREAAVFGSRFTAEKAKAVGIVEHVAPPGKLMEVSQKFASVCLSTPYERHSLHNMKTDVYKNVLREKSNTGPKFASNL